MAWGTFSWKGPEGTGRSPGVKARMLVGELEALESPADIDTWQDKQADDDATLVPLAVASPDGTYDAVLIDGSLPLVSAFVDDLDALDSEVTATGPP